MSWLSALFGRNPTSGWLDAGRVVEADVGSGTLIGKAFGARVSEFASLGPASRWPGKNGGGSLVFPGQGLQIDFEFGQFTGFVLALAALEYSDPAKRPFSGRLLRNGQPLTIKAGDTAHTLIHRLGEPASRETDEDETILRYAYGDVVVEYEIDQEHGLYAIVVIHEGDVDTSAPGW